MAIPIRQMIDLYCSDGQICKESSGVVEQRLHGDCPLQVKLRAQKGYWESTHRRCQLKFTAIDNHKAAIFVEILKIEYVTGVLGCLPFT